MASGILEVSLVEAEGIRERGMLMSCVNCFCPWPAIHPYVSIQFGGQERISCVAYGEGKKLVWDEKFRFDVDFATGEEHMYDKLIFCVMDKHKFSDDVYIGDTTIYVKDVVLVGMEKGKAEFETREHRVVRPDKTYSGGITVAVTFTKGKDGLKGG